MVAAGSAVVVFPIPKKMLEEIKQYRCKICGMVQHADNQTGRCQYCQGLDTLLSERDRYREALTRIAHREENLKEIKSIARVALGSR